MTDFSFYSFLYVYKSKANGWIEHYEHLEKLVTLKAGQRSSKGTEESFNE